MKGYSILLQLVFYLNDVVDVFALFNMGAQHSQVVLALHD